MTFRYSPIKISKDHIAYFYLPLVATNSCWFMIVTFVTTASNFNDIGIWNMNLKLIEMTLFIGFCKRSEKEAWKKEKKKEKKKELN